jgi:nickel/cobalt transporter (NicO) family protein
MPMTRRTRLLRPTAALTIFLTTALVVVGLIVMSDAARAQLGPFAGPRPTAIGGFAGWILAEQAMFYRALAAMLHAARDNGSALWGLMGISFLYGIFHAAGPGHGKAVISSYLLANEETWRRGVTLSFISAAMQSGTAIAIVVVAAVLLGATAKLMGDTVHVIEIVSYSLIVLVGLRLLWVKGRNFASALAALRAGTPSKTADAGTSGLASCGHAPNARFGLAADGTALGAALGDSNHDYHCHHEHDHEHHEHHHHEHHHHEEELDAMPWGHAHGPEPDQLAGSGGWRRGLAAVVSVGLRPCSGAIIVLVFALAQGLFWAGVASTFVMGLGTAITVGTIATLAVGAKTLAKSLAQKRGGYGAVLMRGSELLAACFVLAFGVLLLTGYMASERMGLF